MKAKHIRLRHCLLVLAAVVSVGAAKQARRPPDPFPVQLSTSTTRLLGTSQHRDTNVALAAKKLDGLVIEPGDTFSFNGMVGERTRDAGFQVAPMIENGRLVPSVGGGVCQVSSTLYNAALLADLNITQRQKHSMPIDYLKPGLDATVAWDYLDLKFTNSLDQPIRLNAVVRTRKLTVSVRGIKKLPYRVVLETKVRTHTEKNSDGTQDRIFLIDVHRVRKQGFVMLEREFLHRDRYSQPVKNARAQRTR